ncbi:dipeptidase [Sphingobium sp. BHU LFT2]|uniref:dipeptidase n=1 Tax=Sphingobium sp. BHU LFT2 TaxID=2807634 RepID=UPI001BE89DE6|nr:dipeptidase [Sphingobium sp. BHU LFT2]MBT2242456.1 dipeptidase [Sphingobium sp. BHU LFT2]
MISLRLAALPLLLATVALPFAASAAPASDSYAARIAKVLKATPLIDGHNDWPEAMAGKAGDARWTMPLDRLDPSQYHTDITRLRAGQMGGQFWSVWVSADLPELQQVKDTVEQIELVHSLARRYPQNFTLATTAAEVRAAHKAGRIASMIGVEGGGQIDGSLAVLRAYHDLGAGYLTLTHSRTIAWADSATDNPQHDGLTPFGEAVVHELNRLGMLVDLAHVSEGVMLDALKISKAPVIFSHSSARALCNTPRNVSDAILKQVAANGGVVMVNFAPQYVSEARRVWSAARSAEMARYNAPPFGGLYIGDPEGAKKALAEWEKANPEPVVTLSMVADHIDHIAKVAGVDHVGIGSDFDGVGSLPQGLGSVATYPALLAELMRRGWSDADIAKLAGENVLRVMAAAEKVAEGMKGEPIGNGTVASLDGAKPATKE